MKTGVTSNSQILLEKNLFLVDLYVTYPPFEVILDHRQLGLAWNSADPDDRQKGGHFGYSHSLQQSLARL